MNATISPADTTINPAELTRAKGITIALWASQIAIGGVLGMMAFVKFFNFTPEGSKALADAMGVGRGVITMIGLVEVAVVVLILMPRTHAIGALLGIATMLGALFTHVTKIGFSGNAAAEMWPMALVVLGLSTFIAFARRTELPLGR